MRSEAQRRADKKYKESGKDKYKTFGISMHSDNIKKSRIPRSHKIFRPQSLPRGLYTIA